MSQRNIETRIHRANRRKTLHRFSGIASRNPVFVEGLLLAPVIVASTSLKTAAALSITLAVVTLPTMVVAAMIKTSLPQWLRVPIYTVTAALMLVPATMLVTPIAPTIFDSMGMYFALMIFNSILFTRAERFAIKANPPQALLDGACYCVGFALAIFPVALIREVLAYNSVWGIPFASSLKIGAVVLPFAGFMLVGMLSACGRYIKMLVIKQRVSRRRVKAPVVVVQNTADGGAV